ncbi:MAG: hypothetical protein JWQ87_4504 [Candidatus Sulfotelmatobacter sp.]|nr:hypothetical protein [Candidatus Sulfotelmatobacter sp.]
MGHNSQQYFSFVLITIARIRIAYPPLTGNVKNRRRDAYPNPKDPVEERRFSAASSALGETGLQPQWRSIQPEP